MRPSGSQFLAWGCAVWTSGNLSRDVESRWQRNVGNIDACLPVKYGARILTVWCDMHQIASSQLGPVHSTTCCDVFLRQKGAINTHTQTNTQTHTHKHTHTQTHTHTHPPTHPPTHARTHAPTNKAKLIMHTLNHVTSGSQALFAALRHATQFRKQDQSPNQP